MGHADSPARSNVAARPRRRQKGSVVGRKEKRIRTQDRGANHVKLRPSQHRRRRRQSFAQTRDRAAARSNKALIFRSGHLLPNQMPDRMTDVKLPAEKRIPAGAKSTDMS